MQLTPTYQLKKPEGTDPADIQDFNDNADAIDAALKKKAESSGGDISEMTVKTLDNITTEFPVPAAGEKPKTFLAKVQKFIQDFNNLKTGLLTVGQLVNNCVTNNPSLPLSAAQGKVLMDLYTVLNTNLNNKAPNNEFIWLRDAFNVRYNTTLVNNADAAISSGFYRFFSNSANVPWSGGGTLFVFRYDGDSAVQVAFFNGDSPSVSTRVRYESRWSGWRSL